MRVARSGRAALVVAGTAVLGALLVNPVARASTPAIGSPPSAAGGQQQVRLVTGDLVTLSTPAKGQQSATVLPAHRNGPAGQFQMFNKGGDLYVVPESAMPYLGSTLDPALFDVTQLARQQATRIDVQLRLRHVGGAIGVPGISIEQRKGLAARGSLSPAAARVFGLALAKQAIADHASPTHTTGLFRDVASIAPAGSVTGRPAAVQPSYPMHTLTVHGIDHSGNKDTGDSVALYNVDNISKYAGFAFFRNGVAKVSVPSGHYAAVSFFYDFASGSIYQVTLPQFTVRGDSTVTVDARAATSAVSVKTPKPATPAVLEMAIARADTLGQIGSYAFLAGGDSQFHVKPTTQRVSIGQLHYYIYARELSTAGAKLPYTYDLKFPTDGAILPNQHYAPSQSSLAAIRSSYPASHRNQTALDTRFGALPWEQFLFASDLTLVTPLQRVEYYTARPDLSWQAVYYPVFDPKTFTLLGELDSSWRSYQPGISYSTIFGGQPNHPRLLQRPLYVGQTVCPACLSETKLDVLAFPFSDNSPEHRSYPDGPAKGLHESTSWSVVADGLPVRQGSGLLLASVTPPPSTQVYTINYDTVRSSADFRLSTDVRTSWQVRGDAPLGALPDGWVCDLRGHTKCGVLPLMTSDYQLPLNLLGRIGTGRQHGTVTIGHLAGADGVGVTSLTARTSFDGGKTWRAVRVTDKGGGQFGIEFAVPGASHTDGFGALSIVAKDANGSRLRETIMHAFAVSGS